LGLRAHERLNVVDVGQGDADKRRVETERGVVVDVQQKDPRVTQTSVTATDTLIANTTHVDRLPAAPLVTLHSRKSRT